MQYKFYIFNLPTIWQLTGQRHTVWGRLHENNTTRPPIASIWWFTAQLMSLWTVRAYITTIKNKYDQSGVLFFKTHSLTQTIKLACTKIETVTVLQGYYFCFEATQGRESNFCPVMDYLDGKTNIIWITWIADLWSIVKFFNSDNCMHSHGSVYFFTMPDQSNWKLHSHF